MYPIPEEWLSIRTIALHWSATAAVHTPADLLILKLLAEFWRGHLPIYRANLNTPTDRDELLASFFSAGDDETVAFVESPSDVPETEQYLENGAIEVDLTTYVILPTDRSTWTPGIKGAAFEVLAETFNQLSKGEAPLPESYLQGFSSFVVSKRDFGTMCDLNDWPRPAFWFKSHAPRPSTRTRATDRNALKQWFLEQVREHLEREAIPTKRNLLELAQKQLKSVTDSAFGDVWADHAPKTWKRRGRRKGS